MPPEDPGAGHPVSDRVTVRRLAARGNYDPSTINGILDAGFICHVGFIVDGGPRIMGFGNDNPFPKGSPMDRFFRQSYNSIDPAPGVPCVK